MGRGPCPWTHRNPRIVSKSIEFGINEPRTRKDNNELMVGPEEPSFLGKALWKVETQPPWECCTKGNQSFEKKLQRR